MSVLSFIIILVVGIGLLVFMLTKLNLHAALALFLVAAFFGVLLGFGPLVTMQKIATGFGGTMSGIATTIIFGAVLAMGIMDTGSTVAIANFFIRLFKGKRLELAPACSSFLISIPVFADVTFVLAASIAHALSKRKKVSMTTMQTWTYLGGCFAHAVVPPTPGILAVSIMLGAELGGVVFWGIVVSLICLIPTYLLLRGWINKVYVPPMENYTVGIEETESNDVEQIVIKEENPVSTLAAVMPVLIPVLFITLSSFCKYIFEEGSFAIDLFTFLGDRSVALFSGVIAVTLVACTRKKKVIRNALLASGEISKNMSASEADSLVQKTSFLSIVGNNWFKRGLAVALIPLVVTGMGGALGGILKEAEAVQEMGKMIVGTGVLPVLIPFFTAFIIMTACGSQTMAGMTAAGLMVPLLPTLGISPVLCAIAIGTGTVSMNFFNNSGFWISSEMYGVNAKLSFRGITMPALMGSGFSMVCLIVVNLLNIF